MSQRPEPLTEPDPTTYAIAWLATWILAGLTATSALWLAFILVTR